MKLRLLLILILVTAASVRAGDNPRSALAVRVTTAPRIDGVPDDSVWRLAPPVTDFTQRDPEEGKPSSERSEIRILYDDEALYFGCIFSDGEPDKIVARLTRRDNEIESDEASIRLDSYHDHQTGTEFTFNAAGVKIDKLQYDDAAQEDDSWDPVWYLETRRFAGGWSAEVKIPFRILRYRASGADDSAGQVWGLNLIRYISRKQESDYWAFIPKKESGFISRFGHLTGLRDLPAPRAIEALPFVTGKQSYDPAADPLPRREQFLTNAGLDLKYGLSTNFTLNATFNPDFGQVEADPAVLNLSTFETFYPEKRPFFVEGTQIIHFTTFGGDFGPGMFYSRRIGRGLSPGEVDVPAGGMIEDMPQNVTILGATKLTGKTNGGLSVGMLQALTRREVARVKDPAGAVSEALLEPLADYGVLRLKQDILGNSNVGMILTSTTKDGRYPAFTNGYDWNIKLDEQAYALTGFLALSRAEDAFGDRSFGSAGKVQFGRVGAEHWLWSLDFDFTSPRYNIDDVGFFFSPDDWGEVGTLTYKEDVPSALLRNWSTTLRLHERQNFDGANIAREVNLGGSFLLANYWGLSLSMDANYGLYDHRETRGNGLYRKPVAYNGSVGVASDSRGAVTLSLGGSVGWDDKRKRTASIEATIDVKPLSWMEWSVDAAAARIRDEEAWVLNDTAFSPLRSIFADRSTDEFGMTLRGTVTFTRELTLQLYGQVFLPRGHYENYRGLSGTADFVADTASRNYDFNRHILNSNVVLRWEYSAGSTLFLVWSQARQGGNTGNYFTTLSGDLGDTFLVSPSNVLLLKLSYLLDM